MKQLLKIFGLIIFATFISGCDFDLESIKNKISTEITKPKKVAKLKGYYIYDIDTPLVGIEYQCGNLRGVTDKRGKFYFYPNKECRFSIAGVELRYIYSMDMYESSLDLTLQEDNSSVIEFLKSLNSNKNGDSIVIDKRVKKAIEQLDIKSIPDSKVVLQATIDAINRHLKGEKRAYNQDKIKDPKVNSLALTMGM
jgi:outer membrane lipopolysaccharide assembly protein LptE/RlpB